MKDSDIERLTDLLSVLEEVATSKALVQTEKALQSPFGYDRQGISARYRMHKAERLLAIADLAAELYTELYHGNEF